MSGTHAFLEGRYRDEINRSNPLAVTKGRLAEEYANLIKEMWSGASSSVAPRGVKHQIGLFAHQFTGYAQQDSQELVISLLDGLHEDLNRVKVKPYIEAKDSSGRPDECVAQEAWSDYKKRNDSVIVDLFVGQYRSTLICPQCTKVDFFSYKST